DYFRDIGRMVLAAEGRKANDSHADCYQYFCVPEYGTANGRLHFHAVHFMRTLPTGSVDPNFGRRVRRESVKNDKPTISMSLSHCIHQTLNSKASTRFHSGGLQQSLTLILNTFLFGVIILIANILKRAFSSQLAAKLRNRLLVL